MILFIKKYAITVLIEDLNGFGELAREDPFQPGEEKTVQEENSFHYWERNGGMRHGLRSGRIGQGKKFTSGIVAAGS